MPAGEVTPAGSGVGELDTSVRVPPLTANTDTKCAPGPSTSRYLPPGVSRASVSGAPPLMVKLPTRVSDPSGWTE